MIINSLLNLNPFTFDSKIKNKIFLKKIKLLTLHHYNKCNKYKNIIDSLKFKIKKKYKLEDFPMIPIGLFKKFDFKILFSRF